MLEEFLIVFVFGCIGSRVINYLTGIELSPKSKRPTYEQIKYVNSLLGRH